MLQSPGEKKNWFNLLLYIHSEFSSCPVLDGYPEEEVVRTYRQPLRATIRWRRMYDLCSTRHRINLYSLI